MSESNSEKETPGGNSDLVVEVRVIQQPFCYERTTIYKVYPPQDARAAHLIAKLSTLPEIVKEGWKSSDLVIAQHHWYDLKYVNLKAYKNRGDITEGEYELWLKRHYKHLSSDDGLGSTSSSSGPQA